MGTSRRPQPAAAALLLFLPPQHFSVDLPRHDQTKESVMLKDDTDEETSMDMNGPERAKLRVIQ
jgi:hypothetical protein